MQRREDPYFIPGADDDDVNGVGGSDGDGSGAVQWTRPTADRPWLRSSLPPWHLWGNTQQFTTNFQSVVGVQNIAVVSNQLCKISYRRPETWNWIFSAKLVSGPPSDGVFNNAVRVAFDLIVGVGRSAIVLGPLNPNNLLSTFEGYSFVWGPINTAFPVGARIYTSRVLAPNRSFTSDPPFPDTTGNAVPPAESASVIDKIPAQDLQLNCRLIALTGAGSASLGLPVTVEVSAAFAPSTHVRPDWYQDERVPEVQFAGQETAGT